MTNRDENFEIINSIKGNPLLISNGYTYRKWRENHDVVEWKCTKEKAKCHAVLKTRNNKIVMYKNHVCTKDNEEIEVRKALMKCRERAKTDLKLPMKQIFDEETRKLVADGFKIPKYSSVKSAMNATRRKIKHNTFEGDNQVKDLSQHETHNKSEGHSKLCLKKASSPPGKRDLNEIEKLFEITTTSKGKECLLHEGFVYRKARARDNYVQWRCIKERSNCNATLKTHKGQIIECNTHVCSSDKKEVEIRKLMNNCKKLVETNLQTPVWEIYQKESRDLIERGFTVPKYSNVKTNLNKIRRSAIKSMPDKILPLHLPSQEESDPGLPPDDSKFSVSNVTDRVNLSWTSHLTNMQSVFLDLFNTGQFVDVTLSCEGKSIKCHQAVLAMCSPYFDTVLKQFPCDHPIIIVPNVGFWELQNLVDFMYCGQLNVPCEKLASLVEAATALEIKNISEFHEYPVTTSEIFQAQTDDCSTDVVTRDGLTSKRKWIEIKPFEEEIKIEEESFIPSLIMECEPDMPSCSKTVHRPQSPKRRRYATSDKLSNPGHNSEQSLNNYLISELSSADMFKSPNYGFELPAESSIEEDYSKIDSDKELDSIDISIKPECSDNFEVVRNVQQMQHKYNIT